MLLDPVLLVVEFLPMLRIEIELEVEVDDVRELEALCSVGSALGATAASSLACNRGQSIGALPRRVATCSFT